MSLSEPPQTSSSGDYDTMPSFVGRYEVLAPIASGGMAVVYLARSLGVGGFEREVALKVTHAHLRENKAFVDDLLEEAKLAVRIRHPNVVSVLDVGDDAAGLFLVMDYVEGDTLASLVRASHGLGSPLPARIGFRLLVDVLSGLHAAHELRDDAGRPVGLVHRDFSPQNILIGIDGNARLSDFGIAKAATRLGNTTTGVVKGKLAYMSPEQARGQPLDRRSDIWAAGVVAWEIAAGARLYDADNEAATILRIVSERPPPARSVNIDVPEEIDRVIGTALTTDREHRCPNALTFARQLGAAAQAHDMLASLEEAAAVVSELAAPVLERRRAKIRMIQEARARSIPVKMRRKATASDAASKETSSDRRGAGVTPPSTITPAPLPSEPTPPARPRKAVAIATGVLVLSVIVAAVLVRAAGKDVAPATVSSQPAASAVATVAPSSASADGSRPAALEFLTVSADLPFKSLAIEGRVMEIAPPSARMGVQISADEFAHGISVEATSVDGRVARVICEAGQRTVAIRFAPVRGQGTMGTAPSARLPFAPNPYSGK
jgi:eukaryotic-like serine/threonine-protein kinase